MQSSRAKRWPYWLVSKGRNPTVVAGRELPREERTEVLPIKDRHLQLPSSASNKVAGFHLQWQRRADASWKITNASLPKPVGELTSFPNSS